MIRIQDIVSLAAKRKASDIHLIAGLRIKCRIDGKIVDLAENVLTKEDCEGLAREMAGDYFDRIKDIGELDCGGYIADERVRINLFRQQGAISAAIRILSDKIPELDDLGLPQVVNTFPSFQKGIILVTGETGSGKSTTLAAILDKINHTRNDHIITLEDPVEYVYKPDKCIINQREIGKDTESYQNGLKAILREDPDVILIGEMRDLETIETALTAAETGHLVFATLHTNGAVSSIDRIVSVFPDSKQQQIRLQLSGSLRAVLSQQLLPKSGGKGRVAAAEVMVMTTALQNLIREGKTHQMHSFMLSSMEQGSITMDNCLIKLSNDGKITTETAIEAAVDREYVKKKLTG
ncbi:type IV pili twitching motility protein PilT [Oribacterium sp. C9]|uniref:type IV pilus twitching motility protein PilT n=1 Tax=Oribacterium sp. C9 TaxID=1943579 RepID=UPI00098EB7FA|nr:type IV pilus twitching motility protein PilT [Oribacterium sp. C9]OON84889.1 type IV pili twitching motility protein PilT [Oribacterium sp. C9]